MGPLIDQGINTSRDKLDEDYFHKEVQVEIPIQARSKKSHFGYTGVAPKLTDPKLFNFETSTVVVRLFNE